MKRIEIIDANNLAIDRQNVFQSQGMTEKTRITKTIDVLFEKAVDLFKIKAEPKVIVQEVSLKEFLEIYWGEGSNDEPSVVGLIAPKARTLMLFALTCGNKITDTIKNLLEEKEIALAYMLDVVASEGTEAAADELTRRSVEQLKMEGKFFDGDAMLRYSPGYCGWHVSGQKKLLSFLNASQIGITITEGFLMIPEKSISGVMISGERKIHFFKNNFEFCKSCTHKSCRLRIQSLGGLHAHTGSFKTEHN